MTQLELASAVGTTASFISHLEHGRTRASLPMFQRIARALSVSVSYFLETEAQEETEGSIAGAKPAARNGNQVKVVRPHTRKILLDPASDGIRWELLSPDHQCALEFIMGVYEPGCELGFAEPMSHPGEEYGIVVEGRLEVTVSGEAYILEPWDSIHFNSDLPHTIRNLSHATTRAIWVIWPPAF